jgi:hypothetical protein
VNTASIVREMQAVFYTETSVFFNNITLCYIPEFCHSPTRRPENLRSHRSDLALSLSKFGFPNPFNMGIELGGFASNLARGIESGVRFLDTPHFI